MKKLNRSLLCCGGVLLVALGLTGCASGSNSAPKPTVQQTKASNETSAYIKDSSKNIVQSNHLDTAHNTYDVKFNPKNVNTMKYLNGQGNRLNKLGKKIEHEDKLAKKYHYHNKAINSEVKKEGNATDNLLKNYMNTWSKKSLKQQQEDIAQLAEIGEVQQEIEVSANQNKSKGLALDITNLPRNSVVNKSFREEARLNKQKINNKKNLSKQQKQQALQSFNQRNQQSKTDAKQLGKPDANNKKLKNSQKEIQKASLQIAKSIRQIMNPKTRRQMVKEFDQSMQQLTKELSNGQRVQQPGTATAPNNNLNNNINTNPKMNQNIRANQNKFRHNQNKRNQARLNRKNNNHKRARR